MSRRLPFTAARPHPIFVGASPCVDAAGGRLRALHLAENLESKQW
jgi:hypothetical protein